MTNAKGPIIGPGLPACLPPSNRPLVGTIQVAAKLGRAVGADPREAEPHRLAIRTGAVRYARPVRWFGLSAARSVPRASLTFTRGHRSKPRDA